MALVTHISLDRALHDAIVDEIHAEEERRERVQLQDFRKHFRRMDQHFRQRKKRA